MNKGFRNWARPRHKVYVSEPAAIDTASGNLFRHGFGRVPGCVQIRLLCVAANNGYLAGEEIPIAFLTREAGGDDDGGPRYAWSVNAERVRVFIPGTSIELVDSAAISSGTFNPAQWRLVVRCADIERLT